MQVYYKLYDTFKNITITRDMIEDGFNVAEIDDLVETIRSTHPKKGTPEYELRWLTLGYVHYIKHQYKQMSKSGDMCNALRIELDELMRDMKKQFSLISNTKDKPRRTTC